MATTAKTTASERRGRFRRMRTNFVAAETPDGVHHCLYIGLSADEALRIYARLREKGGRFNRPGGEEIQATRGALILDPTTSKRCSFGG